MAQTVVVQLVSLHTIPAVRRASAVHGSQTCHRDFTRMRGGGVLRRLHAGLVSRRRTRGDELAWPAAE